MYYVRIYYDKTKYSKTQVQLEKTSNKVKFKLNNQIILYVI